MKALHRLLALVLSCAVFAQGCAVVSRNYVVETPRAAAIDEAFYLKESTIQVDDLHYCLRIPLDMGVSLAGLEEKPAAFDYVVSALDNEGHAHKDVSTRYRIFESRADLEICAALNHDEHKQGVRKSLGSFLLEQQGELEEKSLARTFENQDFARYLLSIEDDEWRQRYLNLSGIDLVVRFEQKKAPYTLQSGEQLRVVLKLEEQGVPARGGLAGATEIELQKVRKPRGWLALLIGLSVLGAGTVVIMKTTDQ